MNQLDGYLATIDSINCLTIGTVIRVVQSDPRATPEFSDCVVVNKFWRNSHGVMVKRAEKAEGDYLCFVIARPYARISCADPASPSVLTGVEQFEVAANRLSGEKSLYRVVLQSNGRPANVAYLSSRAPVDNPTLRV